MNVQVMVIALALLIGGWFVYYSWDPKSEDTEMETSIATTEASESNTNKNETKPAPTTNTTPTTPAAPVATGESTRFCPKFKAGAELGAKDTAISGERGDIANLQTFLAQEYSLGASFITGNFESQTQSYLMRYQREEGIPQTGALDYESKRRMLLPCTTGVKANGVEYAKKSFSITPGEVTQSVYVHEALQTAAGTVESGAYRIELISVGSIAQLRVTGPVLGGLQSQRFSLAEGGQKKTSQSPALTIKVVDINSSGATLSISQ